MTYARRRGQAEAAPLRSLPAAALREVIREGYSAEDLKRDVLAGLVVGIVALPLSMALAIAVGVPPQHGLYTAIVAGFLVALLGGSRTQVTGPTAAFIVVLSPITAKFGLGGLLVAGLMGGLLLILMGLLRLGRLIQFIPHPVTTGFTTGIATVIAVLQLKDVLGLKLAENPEHFLERVGVMWEARHTASLAEFGIGALTLLILIFFPKVTRKVPAPLVALPAAALVALGMGYLVDGFTIATIASRFQTSVDGQVFSGIPPFPPLPMLPWEALGEGGRPLTLDFETLRALLPGALAIAILGAIESLLSAVVADGLAQTKHDPDAELLAAGVGNVVAPFFGGIAATGALARTATNIRSGGRTPFAAMTHALVVLAAVLLLAPLIGYLPMASLGALLLLVAWNMSEGKHFLHILKTAPKSDVTVLLTCYGLTVVFDMVISVSVGVVLAALLFMRRMAEVTQAKLFDAAHAPGPEGLPEGVVVYDILGPLFFGAAQKAMSTLGIVSDSTKVVIFRMEQVPAMDATGLVALESALGRLRRQGCLVIVTGLQPQPLGVLQKGGLKEEPGGLAFCPDLSHGLQLAKEFLDKKSAPLPATPAQSVSTA